MDLSTIFYVNCYSRSLVKDHNLWYDNRKIDLSIRYSQRSTVDRPPGPGSGVRTPSEMSDIGVIYENSLINIIKLTIYLPFNFDALSQNLKFFFPQSKIKFDFFNFSNFRSKIWVFRWGWLFFRI